MNTLKTTLLLSALTGLFLTIGYTLAGERGMTAALVLAAVMNFVSYFWSDTLVLRMYRAQAVSREEAPQLYEIVERLAGRAGIPMPRLYVIPDPALNAFATGRGPKHAAVAATSGLLQALSRDELEGVLAHELSHVLNRDILVSTVAATLAAAVSRLAYIAMFWGGNRDDDDAPNPLVGLLMMLLAPLAAMLIQLAVSRSREYGADETGAKLAGHPEGLAHALQKLEQAGRRRTLPAEPATAHLFIVNPLSGRTLMNLFSTHPPIEARIERLMAMRS